MEERLTVKVALTVTNAEGKVTLSNDLVLGEMKLSDVVNVEKSIISSLASLLESQNR